MTEAQKALVYKKFDIHREDLEYAIWSDIPILFTSPEYFKNNEAYGFIVIPTDFDPKQYLYQNLRQY